MKIGIVGNRNGWELLDVTKNLKRINITENDIIVTGGAVGVDSFAVYYAKQIGADIIIYHPRKSVLSPERYFERNKRIVDNVDKLVAFNLPYNRHSRTRYTINYAIEKKIPINLIDKK